MRKSTDWVVGCAVVGVGCSKSRAETVLIQVIFWFTRSRFRSKASFVEDSRCASRTSLIPMDVNYTVLMHIAAYHKEVHAEHEFIVHLLKLFDKGDGEVANAYGKRHAGGSGYENKMTKSLAKG
jgi:hypothetical protein